MRSPGRSMPPSLTGPVPVGQNSHDAVPALFRQRSCTFSPAPAASIPQPFVRFHTRTRGRKKTTQSGRRSLHDLRPLTAQSLTSNQTGAHIIGAAASYAEALRLIHPQAAVATKRTMPRIASHSKPFATKPTTTKTSQRTRSKIMRPNISTSVHPNRGLCIPTSGNGTSVLSGRRSVPAQRSPARGGVPGDFETRRLESHVPSGAMRDSETTSVCRVLPQATG